MREPANARSRRTRAALLDATRAILEEQGFEGLTMGAVAERAGVTRRAVYLHFASRADLVASLFDHLAASERLAESLQAVWDAPDAGAALDAWARHLASYHSRLIAVTRAVERVRVNDPDAAAHHERVAQAQMANARRLAERLEAEGRLAPPWTVEMAADMLFGLVSTDLVERLLVERRWSRRALAQRLGWLLRGAFSARPPGEPEAAGAGRGGEAASR